MNTFDEQIGDRSFFLSITGTEMAVVMAGLMMFEESGGSTDEKAREACASVKKKILAVSRAEANKRPLE